MRVAVSDIIADPAFNSRTTMDDAALSELVASIRAVGLLQPPVVRPVPEGFHLVAGFRRHAAITILGWTHVDVTVLDIDEAQARAINLEENLARHDLNPLEQALALAKLFPDQSTREIAEKIHRSQFWVTSRLQILQLSDRARAWVAAGRIPVSRVPEILNSAFPNDAAKKVANKKPTKSSWGKRTRNRGDVHRMAENLDALDRADAALSLRWSVGDVTTEQLLVGVVVEPKETMDDIRARCFP